MVLGAPFLFELLAQLFQPPNVCVLHLSHCLQPASLCNETIEDFALGVAAPPRSLRQFGSIAINSARKNDAETAIDESGGGDGGAYSNHSHFTFEMEQHIVWRDELLSETLGWPLPELVHGARSRYQSHVARCGS